MKNKKAAFFTILAIVMLSLFLVSFAFYNFTSRRNVVTRRIETMNSFVFSLQKDISRQIYISGYRGTLALQDSINIEGEFLNSSEEAFKEVLLNGTIKGQHIELMEGYKIEDWSTRIDNLSRRMNVYVNYSLKEVHISQEDPWNIKISVIMDLDIRDKTGLASWNKTETISSKIGITNFEDPLYIINTNGKIPNKINQTPYSFFVNGSDVSNLESHVNKSFYIASSSAPSFLDRLEGKTEANENGIESFVYLPKLGSQGIPTKDKSAIDYIYFSSSDPVSYNVQGMPSWFKIDENHVSIYGVGNLTY